MGCDRVRSQAGRVGSGRGGKMWRLGLRKEQEEWCVRMREMAEGSLCDCGEWQGHFGNYWRFFRRAVLRWKAVVEMRKCGGGGGEGRGLNDVV